MVLKESLSTRTKINIILTSLILPRTMTMLLQLEHDRIMVLIFAYAPTFLAADDDKEAFYDCLNSTIRSVPLRHRLLLLGDFSVHVNHHCHIVAWPNVPVHHSVGRENSNSALLLETRAKHELVITNTLFQMPNKYKTTWQHPRSKHACSELHHHPSARHI